MPDCADLEEKARNSPHNFDFSDLLKLAECFGYEEKRQRGSHHVFQQTTFPRQDTKRKRKEYDRMNFQSAGGQAKSSQVNDLLNAIDYFREEYSDWFHEPDD